MIWYGADARMASWFSHETTFGSTEVRACVRVDVPIHGLGQDLGH